MYERELGNDMNPGRRRPADDDVDDDAPDDVTVLVADAAELLAARDVDAGLVALDFLLYLN